MAARIFLLVARSQMSSLHGLKSPITALSPMRHYSAKLSPFAPVAEFMKQEQEASAALSSKAVSLESVLEEKTEEEQEDAGGEYVNPVTGEIGGPRGPEPTRFGDWERKGRCSDF